MTLEERSIDAGFRGALQSLEAARMFAGQNNDIPALVALAFEEVLIQHDAFLSVVAARCLDAERLS